MALTLPPVLFRDQRFVVLDKPAGLPVHPGPRGGPNVEALFPLLSRRRAGPWLVHRLDSDTAGCLLIALRHAVLLEAQAEFAAGRARKVYWAVVRGEPPAEAGTADAPLSRRTSPGRVWRMAVDAAGKNAITDWTVRGRAEGVAWLELRPRTGRTHQIRAHCAAVIGCPVLGDPVYGDDGEKLHLLARSLDLALEPPVSATAPPPAHMREALGRCGWVELQPTPDPSLPGKGS